MSFFLSFLSIFPIKLIVSHRDATKFGRVYIRAVSSLGPHHHMSIHSLLQVNKAYYGFVLQVLLTQIQGEYKIENQILIMLLQ
jgi:hypothetical protein